MKSFEDLVQVVPPGRYVVAVSGGVDSAVLFDVLRKRPELELIVAHFDHRIRKSSQQDRKFVQELAMSHNLQFEFAEGNLGSQASEATAREQRYMFLRHICKKYNAAGIILAHHQDDLFETAIINLLRGTGRRGLSSLRSHPRLLRPLLEVTKQQILTYAQTHHIPWREDSTNLDQSYLRNYVRHTVLAKMDSSARKRLLQIIVRQIRVNQRIDKSIELWLDQQAILKDQTATLPRYQLIMMPRDVAYEILQAACKKVTGKTTERQLMERALLFVKTALPHKQFVLNNNWRFRAGPREVIVEPRMAVLTYQE